MNASILNMPGTREPEIYGYELALEAAPCLVGVSRNI